VREDTAKDKIRSAIKRTAVNLHLMPKTMKGKEFLKRIFMGKLVPLPPEITDGMAEYTPPTPINHNICNVEYKVLFAIGYVK
jgi:galactose-1-phosphate uridylyltransferase